MKQTAVEWLVEKLEIFATEEEMNIIDQAKAMEKEHIIEAYKADCETLGNDDTFHLEAEQYFNKTFKSE